MRKSLDFIFQALIPKDTHFYPLFYQDCENMVEATSVLEKALKADSVTRINCIKKIEILERQGDEITHAIIKEAGNTFIVPFDREDIQYLAIAIDDIVDYVYGAAKRIDLYKIYTISPQMIRLSELLNASALELQSAILEMRHLRQVKKTRQHIERINTFRSEANNILKDTIALMFRTETDAMNILKTKEIITFLKIANDKCRDAANVIEGVIIKFS